VVFFPKKWVFLLKLDFFWVKTFTFFDIFSNFWSKIPCFTHEMAQKWLFFEIHKIHKNTLFFDPQKLTPKKAKFQKGQKSKRAFFGKKSLASLEEFFPKCDLHVKQAHLLLKSPKMAVFGPFLTPKWIGFSEETGSKSRNLRPPPK
jgi:hypothetical protein